MSPFQKELYLLSPSPITVGEREIFSLTVIQVLGYLARVDNQQEIESFLLREHKHITPELKSLYQASLLLLKTQDSKNELLKNNDQKPPFNSNSLNHFIITSSLHAVSETFSLSWNEVLNMSVAHFHLCLGFTSNLRDIERKAREEVLRTKKKKKSFL